MIDTFVFFGVGDIMESTMAMRVGVCAGRRLLNIVNELQDIGVGR